MINVIVPIAKNAQDYYKILGRLGHLESVSVHLGVCENEYDAVKLEIGEANNIYIHCYADGTHREEMINSLQGYLEVGQTMIMRKPITMEEFNKFILQKKDVVTCEKKTGRFKRFMLSLWQKILRAFLGVRLYEGDSSVIYFSEEISMVLSQSGNLSFSSRVDRWRGIEQATVPTKGEPVKTPIDKKKNLIYIISAAVSIVVATVVSVVVFMFAKLSVIVGLLVACLDILALAVAIIMCVMIAFNYMVGKKHFNKGFEIQKEEMDEE